MVESAGQSFDMWAVQAVASARIAADVKFDGLNVRNLPPHGVGRGFKASKEAIVGLLLALERFQQRDIGAACAEIEGHFRAISDQLNAATGLKLAIVYVRPETLPSPRNQCGPRSTRSRHQGGRCAASTVGAARSRG